MSYCSQDVKCTKDVLSKVYPLYIQRCPHPASLAGLLELSSVYLPVNQSWKAYIESAKFVIIANTRGYYLILIPFEPPVCPLYMQRYGSLILEVLCNCFNVSLHYY